MPRSKKAPDAGDDQNDQIAVAVRDLTEQVGLLRTVLDELRSAFVWAVRNDKLRCPESPAATAQPPATPTIELDKHQFEAMAEAVKDSLQDLAGDVGETVREDLRQEVAQLRDAMDQLSTDLTWAVRTVRQASPNQLATEQEHPEPDDNQAPTDSIELQYIARKAFTGSAAVAHAAQSEREGRPLSEPIKPAPSDVRQQRSFLDTE